VYPSEYSPGNSYYYTAEKLDKVKPSCMTPRYNNNEDEGRIPQPHDFDTAVPRFLIFGV
jgi:hypothetical protein